MEWGKDRRIISIESVEETMINGLRNIINVKGKENSVQDRALRDPSSEKSGDWS